MAIPAGGIPSEVQTGDTVHVRGGQHVGYLTGTFVKSVSESSGTVTVVYQDTGGIEQTLTYTGAGGGALLAADMARLAKIPGFTTLFQDFRNHRRLSPGTSRPTPRPGSSIHDAYQHGDWRRRATSRRTPTDVLGYRVCSTSCDSGDGPKRYPQLPHPPRSRRLTTYHFEGNLFPRRHSVGSDTHYYVFQIANVADGVELTIEARNSAGSETTEYSGQTLAWRQHMSVTNLARNLSGVGATTQAALDHLDDLILGDVHVIDTYGHLPAPSAEYVENAYYIRQNNELYACVNNFTHATPQTGDFNNTSLPNTRRVRRTLDAAFSVPLHTYEYAHRRPPLVSSPGWTPLAGIGGKSRHRQPSPSWCRLPATFFTGLVTKTPTPMPWR